MTEQKLPDHTTLGDVFEEITEQPDFRAQADREMDYCDGNQLDSALLKFQRENGIPSSIENIMGPAMIDIEGSEAQHRTDWLVESDDEGDDEGEAVAKATSYKLNQAERRSGADLALTQLYASTNRVGLGFVDVGREADPFKYPYKVEFIHRNEMYWDWFAKCPHLSDARWMLRRRWGNINAIVKKFPQHEAVIRSSGHHWGDLDSLSSLYTETGSSTDLYQHLDIARGWSVEEQEWRDPTGKRACLFQLDTMEEERKEILTLRTGRKVEFDEGNPLHRHVVINELGRLSVENISYPVRSIFIGPHLLQQERQEHSRYSTVPCFSRREDRTRVPYGAARWLIYPQDEINARVSKMQWLLGSVQTIRTDGAVKMEDEIFRQTVSRPDSDIVLDQDHMAKLGARFEISRNHDLNSEQAARLRDLKDSVKRLSGVSDAMSGDGGHNTADGLSQMIEQSALSLATLNDNFSASRKVVGELILGMIVRDIGNEETNVVIKGSALKESEVITLNSPAKDLETGQEYLSNDTQRAMLKVELEEVPSTPSYKQQALVSLTEVIKASDQQLKDLLYPYYFALTNVANKDDIIRDLMEARQNGRITPEMVQEQIKEAVKAERESFMYDLKLRELDQRDRELNLKEEKTLAEVEKIVTEQVNNRIEAIYSAVQAGHQIVSAEGVASVADQVLNSAGAEDQDTAPIVAPPSEILDAINVDENTSPMFPPRADNGRVEEVEAPDMSVVESPAQGAGKGIEAAGVQ